MTVALLGENITKIYRVGGSEVRALDNVNVKIASGEFVVIHGASGAGKSTLLYVLGGLTKPDTGVVKVENEELACLDDNSIAELRRHKIGFVFQFFYLLPAFNVLQNVLVPLHPVNISKAEKIEIAEKALARVGIAHRKNHLPHELSAGEQQRVGIARALVNNPRIILADEPTSDLDRKNVEGVIELFCQLNKENVTVVIATHDSRVIDKAQRLIEMEDGRIK